MADKQDNTSTDEVDLLPGAIDECVNGIRLIDMTKDDMIESVTEQYLLDINPNNPYDIIQIKADLSHLIHIFILAHNKLPNCQKWKGRETLYPMQIAMIVKKLYHIRRINMGGEESEMNSKNTLLAIYEESGENEGIYIADESKLESIICEFNKDISERELKLVIRYLNNISKIVNRTCDIDLIAVQNGIFNYKTKQLMPFSPDYVFIAKCKVAYRPNPTNPIIYNDDDGTSWDAETWMDELFEDDPDIVNALWQIIGATIRPNVPWKKAVWFLSTRGNNGKGTLCELIRNLIGHGSYASIKLADFSKDFMLEPLLHATAIITDENDVGTYIDKAANLKAVITNDSIQINRKFQPAISYQFRGFMIQCVNEVPKIRDRSESFYRRQMIIKFKKSYTGIERKYIKEDYLQRKDVLEYVLHKVLNMNYYEIDEPEACREQLELYKVHNDPVRDFLNEVIPQIRVEAIPTDYLYALYGAWLEKNNPAAKKFMLGSTNFITEVKELIVNFPQWYFPKGQFRVRHYLDGQELTLYLYNMTDWMDDANSDDPDVRYHLKWKRDEMRGMLLTKYKNRKPGRPKKEDDEDDDIDNDIDILGSMQCD